MRFIVIIVISILSLTSYAQVFHKKIEWKESKTLYFYINDKTEPFNVLNFTGASHAVHPEFLPVYSEDIKIESSNTNATITDLNFASLTTEEENILISSTKISEEINFDYDIVRSRNQNFLSVNILPFRRNTATGKIEKLLSFNINITEKSHKKTYKSFTYQSNSVLANGNWYKIQISESGIYKITYDELTNMGFNSPENISLWGSHDGLLSYYVSNDKTDDLKQSAIWIEKGSDNIFNQGDYILFFASGPNKWKLDESKNIFKYHKHYYSKYANYFLTDGISNPKRIESINQAEETENYNSYAYNDFLHHEKQDTNLIGSGREWYGDRFNYLTTKEFSYTLDNLHLSSPIHISAEIAARSSQNTTLNTYLNSNLLGTTNFENINYSYTMPFANEQAIYYQAIPNDELINIQFSYNKYASSDDAWIDFFSLNFIRNLELNNSPILFRDISSKNKITKYYLENTGNSTLIWNITDPYNSKNINYTSQNSTATLKIESDTISEFAAFNKNNVLIPIKAGIVENQDIHGSDIPELVIVSHSKFLSQANILAEYHRNTDNMQVLVLSNEQVYNEFSSGTPDVSAIRNLCKMFYDRSTNFEFKYLLLVGDGSYDYSTPLNEGNPNYVLTYETENSLNPTSSFVSDDYFGLLDENEGEYTGLLDIGIGRLPVKTQSEASAIIEKIKAYNNHNNFGSWINRIVFVGDDEDGNLHMKQANQLATMVNTSNPEYNCTKIFLDAYEQSTSSSGETYPQAKNAINDAINSGALIFNYTGHGSELGLAHEKVITLNGIQEWKNKHLPLFMTATCEFSRYDDPNLTSAGEWVLLNPNGGGIALFTTTRLVFADANFKLNTSFYKYAFKDSSYRPRLGDLIRLSKTDNSGVNKRNFSLLGDPALMLHYPEYTIHTESINNILVSEANDTISAFEKVNIKGYISDQKNRKISDFNGTIIPSIYDKAKQTQTLNNDGHGIFDFSIQNNILFKGKATVKDGSFNFEFMVPKDINYNFGKGKLSYLAEINGKIANGFSDNVIIGGTSQEGLNDDEGPEIELYLNSDDFIDGGYTNQTPKLIAKLKDDNSINTTGNGLGHDIVAIIDEDIPNPVILNEYYEADLDSYQSGKILYSFNEIEDGEHLLEVKAWDIANNSSSEKLSFIVANSDDFTIKNVFNFPNPFTENTDFYFEHNQPGQTLDILIQIFTVSGKIVKTIRHEITSEASISDPVHWDGLDDFGDKIGRGVYIYRLKVRSNDKQVEKIEKLVILK